MILYGGTMLGKHCLVRSKRSRNFHRRTQRSFRIFFRPALLALMLLAFAHRGEGQGYLTQIGDTPNGTRVPVELGNYDASTGNLHLEIPLGTWTERGSNGFTAALVYDSRIWFPSGSWHPTNIPVANWAGWRLITSPAIGGSVANTTQQFSCTCWEPPCHNTAKYYTYTQFKWTDTFGTIHTFPIFTESDPNNCDQGNTPSDTE